MKYYNWIELIGKIMLLISIGGQLSLLAIAQKMTNIVESAQIHAKLDKIWHHLNYDKATENEIYHLKNIPWEWWDYNSWGTSLFYQIETIIYISLSVIFIIGTVFTVLSRFLEMKDSVRK